ncbi:B3 domain-containing protein Os07g0563300-like [Hibiscus syriacus]|uniref:B3 domain-containing protein Os07g0563300-like n=1 Tax=Hibiscus syriacus TaxID=106335 RepID=UPI0019235CDC|nr:B3 domain-containing protein Os07g0563300-like [Hibiscus syriacus]
MLRREKKQSQKETETTGKKQQTLLANKVGDGDPPPCTNAEIHSPKPKKVATKGSDEDPNRVKSSTSPFKVQIDLNIQPEREEELSPGSHSGSMMRLLQDATDIYLRKQSMLTSGGNSNLEVTQTQPGGGLGKEKN